MRPVRIRSTRSTTRGLSPKTEPSTLRPSFAIVEYARAISSGFTATDPSPIEKYASSGLRIPRACAVSTIAFGPTRSVSCAYTVLSEDTRARAEVDAPQVRVVVVRDRPDPVARVDRDLLRLELGQRRDSLAHGGREDDGLERRTGLPGGLRGQVELALAEVPSSEHRLDRARVGLDRDECGRRPVGVAQDTLDRRARELLELEVDRRRHLEPAAEDAPCAVLLDELVLDVVDEVLSRALGPGKPHVLGVGKRASAARSNVLPR